MSRVCAGSGGVPSFSDVPVPAVAVFPICGEPAADVRGCVSRDRLEPAVQLLSAVQPALIAAARDALCGRRELPAVPLTELADVTNSPLVGSQWDAAPGWEAV